MRILRSSHVGTIGLAFGLALTSATVHAQEPLSRAKAYYASAAYEDALQALDGVHGAAPVQATEIAAYRVFCLLALGRTDEARGAVEALVRTNPLYRPSEEQASPRVRTFIDDVRRPMIAEVTRETYAAARAAFAQKDLATASEGFDRVLALLSEAENPDDGDATDMRTLAAGFKELTDASLAKAKVEAEAAAKAEAEAAARAEAEAAALAKAEANAAEAARMAEEAAAAAAEPDPNRIYTEDAANVVPPVVVARVLPPWGPSAIDVNKTFSGLLELVIDQNGRVESSMMRESVHPAYDRVLLSAAKNWRFKPATLDGTPVKYLYRLGLKIGG